MSRLLGCGWVKEGHHCGFLSPAKLEELKSLSSLNAPFFHSLPALSSKLKTISISLTKTAMETKGTELDQFDTMPSLQASTEQGSESRGVRLQTVSAAKLEPTCSNPRPS